MTAQLLNLDGTPLSWPEALERVRIYWETHERDGEIKRPLPLPSSGSCAHRVHSKCRAETCGCWCHS